MKSFESENTQRLLYWWNKCCGKKAKKESLILVLAIIWDSTITAGFYLGNYSIYYSNSSQCIEHPLLHHLRCTHNTHSNDLLSWSLTQNCASFQMEKDKKNFFRQSLTPEIALFYIFFFLLLSPSTNRAEVIWFSHGHLPSIVWPAGRSGQVFVQTARDWITEGQSEREREMVEKSRLTQ